MTAATPSCRLPQPGPSARRGRSPRLRFGAAPSADAIHRRFFAAGIALSLTAGAAWGVWLLWKIGFAERFTGVSIHEVNAHGHAQVFGWLGLFIMGFAYQAFPRFWRTRLAAPRLAGAVFAAMVAGIVAQTTAMAMHDQPWAVPTLLVAGGLQVAAILVFAAQLAVTFLRSGGSVEPYVAYIAAALGFFVLQAPLGLWHAWNTMTAESKGEMLYYVQAYQPLLRGLQVHGMAVLMVLGVSQRFLPAAFGARPIRPRRAWLCLALLLAGVVGEAICFLGHGLTGHHAWAGAVMLPWALFAAGAVTLVWPWRLWRPLPVSHRSTKFFRAGYAWFGISLAMLMLLPVYQIAAELAFSHAYYGAIRHAITVGFLSMMIMGVAAKVVPAFAGADAKTLSPLWGPFILVNTGCALRVSLQTLTDWHPAFFGIVGFSGLLELAGLTWWGLHLIGLMHATRRAGAASEAPVPLLVTAAGRA